MVFSRPCRKGRFRLRHSVTPSDGGPVAHGVRDFPEYGSRLTGRQSEDFTIYEKCLTSSDGLEAPPMLVTRCAARSGLGLVLGNDFRHFRIVSRLAVLRFQHGHRAQIPDTLMPVPVKSIEQ
jgi:hypothetical protein